MVPRGELDKLEGPKYAARRAEFAERREKPREQGIGRRRRRRRMKQESDATEDEAAGEREANNESGTTPRGGI